MKKRFLNIGLLLTMSFAIINFISCNNEPDEPKEQTPDIHPAETITEIRAERVLGGSTTDVETIKLYGWSDFERNFDVIAQAPFINGGFTLKLPETLADEYLFLLSQDAPETVTISDRNAMVYSEFLEAYNKNGKFVGYIGFIGIDYNRPTYYEAVWFYADGDFYFTGKHEQMTFNVSLKKGWNVIYFVFDFVDETELLTSTPPPADIRMRWHFEPSESKSTRTKSLRSAKSLFAK